MVTVIPANGGCTFKGAGSNRRLAVLQEFHAQVWVGKAGKCVCADSGHVLFKDDEPGDIPVLRPRGIISARVVLNGALSCDDQRIMHTIIMPVDVFGQAQAADAATSTAAVRFVIFRYFCRHNGGIAAGWAVQRRDIPDMVLIHVNPGIFLLICPRRACMRTLIPTNGAHTF